LRLRSYLVMLVFHGHLQACQGRPAYNHFKYTQSLSLLSCVPRHPSRTQMKVKCLLALAVASFPGVLGSVEKRQSFEDNSAQYVFPVGSRSSPSPRRHLLYLTFKQRVFIAAIRMHLSHWTNTLFCWRERSGSP
jgi:hypothetical protein